jgi:hypothetical protein
LGESLQCAERNGVLRNFYCELLQVRKSLTGIGNATTGSVRVQPFETQNSLAVHYGSAKDQACLILNFSADKQSLCVDLAEGMWELKLDSKDRRWGGPGSELEHFLVSEGRTLIEVQPSSGTLLVCAT